MKFPHKHQWYIQYDLPGGLRVRVCHKCDKPQSRMFNYFTKEWEWIDGNFIIDNLRHIYVLAGNFEEFLEAKEALINHLPANVDQRIVYVNCSEVLFGVTRPFILFWGTWYKNGILEDPQMTHILNNRI